MSLLDRATRRHMLALLASLPLQDTSAGRTHLLIDLPPALRATIIRSDAPALDLARIVDACAGWTPADAATPHPLQLLLENAWDWVAGSTNATALQTLLTTLFPPAEAPAELRDEPGQELRNPGARAGRQPAPFRPAIVRIPLATTPCAVEPVISLPVDIQANGTDTMVGVDSRLLGAWADRAEILYAFSVQDHSLIDWLIAAGDILILARQDAARNGDLVAVWLAAEQATTLARIYWAAADGVRLDPAHPSKAPLVTTRANVRILGRIVAVLRRCD